MPSHRSRDFQLAKRAKKDEFYTMTADIEAEVMHYAEQFEGKTVYMNCDDPRYSGFFRFFVNNFEKLGLRGAIASGFEVSNNTANGHHKQRGVWAEYKGMAQNQESSLPGKAELKPLKGDGDFRSNEARVLLERADIIVTNPPFSLFSEYITQMIESNKKLLILGNMNALTYSKVFPLFKNNRLWYGRSIHSGDREFLVPPDYPLNAASTRIDERGNKYIRVKGVRWFTNLIASEGFSDLQLTKQYSEELYPQYVNYPAIEVSRTADIPMDYFGEMGVPISYMDHYNPNQFKIVGSSKELARPMSEYAEPGTFQNGGPRFYLRTETGYRRMYERIVIKRCDTK